MRILLALLLIWPLTAQAATVQSPALTLEDTDWAAALTWVQPKAAPVDSPVAPQDPVHFELAPPPATLITPEPRQSLALELARFQTNEQPDTEPLGYIFDVPIAFALLVALLCILKQPQRRVRRAKANYTSQRTNRVLTWRNATKIPYVRTFASAAGLRSPADANRAGVHVRAAGGHV